MDMNWKKEVLDIVKDINLSANNIKFRDIIKEPWEFYHSKPGKFGSADQYKDKETKWQRELFKTDTIYWYDGELPIGQVKECGKVTKVCRVDLVGMFESHPVICELKFTKKAGQPFDALLQLLAYYCMIKQNAKLLDENKIHHAKLLDENKIHHANARRNKEFCWRDIANNNPILMLRANSVYWSNKDKRTPKNEATKKILKVCKEHGLDIRFWNGKDPIDF